MSQKLKENLTNDPGPHAYSQSHRRRTIPGEKQDRDQRGRSSIETGALNGDQVLSGQQMSPELKLTSGEFILKGHSRPYATLGCLCFDAHCIMPLKR